MAKTSEYWKDRFIDLENASNRYGQECFRKIEPAFDKAQREIQKEINSWYGRFAKNNQITIEEAKRLLNSKELKELKWDVQEYIKYGHENGLNQMWMKELENASARYHISRLEALKLRTQHAIEVAFGNELDEVDSMVRKVFTEDYYHSIFEVQKGFNIGWNIGQIDERKLEKLISKPWTTDNRTFKDRIWNSKNQMVNELHQQLTRTCVLGKSPDEAIKELTKYVDKDIKNKKYVAGRLVMTEQAYFHSVAQKEAFKELDVEEFEIVATLDSHTSAICQDMDGKHFPMSEYQPGATAPPFHVFCRSVTCPYFDDEFSLGERAARDEDGKTYYVPSDMKYKDWKKSLVDGKNTDLTNVSLNDTMDLNRNIQRKDSNLGVFSNLKVPMQKRKVKEIAQQYGVDISGLTIKIQRSEKLLSLPITGSTDYKNIGRIDLFPNAFMDEEQLVRTLIHEKCHVNQLKKYGLQYVQEHLDDMEKEAYALEENWFINQKKVKE